MAFAAMGEAAGQRGADGPGPRGPGRRAVVEQASGAAAIQPLLARLWASGFFKRNEAVLREIRNNTYSFFDKNSPKPPEGVKGLGCFSSGPDGRGTIYLRKDLLARFEVGLEGVEIYPEGTGRAMPVLIHEICHDFWANILDEGERASFTREGVEFMEEYRRAQTAEDRRLFLARAGDDITDPATLRSYAGIDLIAATFPPRSMRGHEFFAWLAERLFTTKARIPNRLGKYYTCILDGAALDPGRSRD
jgi:hypothetical protein